MTSLSDTSSTEGHKRTKSHRVLIISDNSDTCKILGGDLKEWGYKTCKARDIMHVPVVMRRPSPPRLFIIDCNSSPSECNNTCHAIRTSSPLIKPYVIILTPDIGTGNMLYGPGLYADDFLKKPYDREELYVRIKIGIRVLGLQAALSTHICDPVQTADRGGNLHGLLSICSHCKKIRDELGRWNEIERYISMCSDTQFSHAICPDCLKKFYPDVANEHT